MSDKDGAAENALARVRRAWSPGASDVARVRLGIDRAIARAIAAGTPPAVERTTSASRAGLGIRIALAGALAAATGGVGYWAGLREGRHAAPAPAPAPPEVRPLTAAPPVAPNAERPVASPPALSRRDAHAVHHEGGAPTTPSSESLAIELRALRNAERALRDSKPGLALAFLQELDRRVPNGKMTEERSATRAIARCAQGNVPFGVDLAADFESRHPASVYRARVEHACAATDSAGSGDSPGGGQRNEQR